VKCVSQSVSLDNSCRQKWHPLTVDDGDEIVIRVVEAEACDPTDVVSHEPNYRISHGHLTRRRPAAAV
jgi:hypothetical protein